MAQTVCFPSKNKPKKKNKTQSVSEELHVVAVAVWSWKEQLGLKRRLSSALETTSKHQALQPQRETHITDG